MAVKLAGSSTVGGVVSVTVTVNAALLALPCASVAEQVTVVAPMAKELPLAGTQLGATAPSTRSAAVAAKVTAAPAGPVASAATAAGKESAGGRVSTMVTVTIAVEVLPAASVTVSAMLCTPTVSHTSAVGLFASVLAPSDQTNAVVDPEESDPSRTTRVSGPVASTVMSEPARATTPCERRAAQATAFA